MDKKTINVEGHEISSDKDVNSIKSQVLITAFIACIILSVGLGYKLYKHKQANRIATASNLLFSAKSLDDLETVTDQYANTPVAASAHLKLAKALFNAGNYDAAFSKYKEFDQKFPDNEMTDVATMGKIHCMEARGEIQSALEAFSTFSSENKNSYLKPQAELGYARCLEELGNIPEANAAYEDFITANPNSAWTERAEDRIQILKAKKVSESNNTPEANITNAPAISANNSSTPIPSPIEIAPKEKK